MKIASQHYRRLKVSELTPHPRNPRRGDTKIIRESIEANDFVGTILVQKSTGYVLAGNHRLLVAREEGATELPAMVIDCDDETALRILLADNGTSDAAGYAEEELLALLKEIGGERGTLEGTGFDLGGVRELERVLERLQPMVEDEPPPLPAAARTKQGEVHELGPHRLICGDATSSSDIATLMDGATASALVTDPPYGVDYGEKNEYLNANGIGRRIDEPMLNDDLDGDELLAFLQAALTVAAEVTDAGGAIYLWHGDGQGLTFRKAKLLAGWYHSQTLVWVKSSHVVGRQDYQWKHEPVLYGWREGAAHRWFGGMAQSTVIADDDVNPRTLKQAELVRLVDELRTALNEDVMREAKPAVSELHPTMKPIRLLAHFVRNSTLPGEIVLDPFGGSGSTMIAAEQLGRRCYMAELDPAYCDVIRDRYEAFVAASAAA